jgi:hypothetical protein
VRVRRRETFDSSATPALGQKLERPRKLADVDLDQLRRWLAAAVDEPRASRRGIAGPEQPLQPQRVLERIEVAVLTTDHIDQLHQLMATLRSVAGEISTALARVHGPLKGQRATPRN